MAASDAAKRASRKFYNKRMALVGRFKRRIGCSICGYNAHQAALDFDHIDPNTKSGRGVADFYTASLPKLKAEIAKCRILCANCHRVETVSAIHEGKISTTNTRRREKEK